MGWSRVILMSRSIISYDRGEVAEDFGGGGRRNGFDRCLRKGETVEMKLVCSLQELYTGCMRNVKISRIVIDEFGYTSSLLDDVV